MTRPARLLDTHCHVDLFPDPNRLLWEIERTGVITVAVTNLPSHFLLGQPHFHGKRFTRPAVGLHPLLVRQHTERERADFLKALKLTSYVGEIGLDGSLHGRATLGEQRESFTFALAALRDRPRFVTVHSRGAEEEVLAHLTQAEVPGAVFHWYTGPLRLMEAILHAGHFFSVNPAMLGSASGRRVIERIPPERLLTETDGPHVKHAARPAQPRDVLAIVDELGTMLRMPADKLATRIEQNFRGLIQRLGA